MKIMFVCTDNFTRSVTAELCLRHYLTEQGLLHIECASSGTHSNSDVSGLSKEHFERMTELGVDISEFNRLQFSEEFLTEYDVIVAMAKEHQDYVQNEYDARIPLFNELHKGEETSIDIKGVDEEKIRAALRETVDYINSAIPRFLRALNR